MPVPSSRYSLPSSSYRSSPYLSSSLERSYASRTVPRQARSKASSSCSSPSSCSSYSRKSSLSDDCTVSSLISNTYTLSVREKNETRDNTTKTRNDVSNYLSRRYSHTASVTLAGLELYSKYMPSNYIGANTGKVSSAKPPLSQSDYSSSPYSISKSVRSVTSPIVERSSSSIGSRLAEKSYATSTAIRGSTFPSLESQGSFKMPSSKSEVILNLNHGKKRNYDQPSFSSFEDDSTAGNNGNDLQSYVSEVKHKIYDVESRGAEAVGHMQLGVVHSSQNTQQNGKTANTSTAKSQSPPALPRKFNSSESTTSSSSSSEEEGEESDGSEEKDTINKSMKSGRLGGESNETLHTCKSNVATLGITDCATSAADSYSSLCSNRLIDHPFVSSISNKQHSVHGSPERAALDGSYSSLRSSHQAHRSPKTGLIGLRNIGNTCFMNSVIQCLSNTKPLLEYLLGDSYLSDINTTISSMKGALIKAFSTVIQALWRPGSDERVINTTSLKSQIQRFAPRFMGFNQQDAQEFLRYLLEGLHEDVNRVTTKPIAILSEIDEHLSDQQKAAESWKRYLRIDDSKIVDIFVGQLKSTLRCTSCGHSSVTFDPFWDLSLPIPARTGQVRLQQCFEVFTREEILDGDEKPTCSKCEMRRKCTKSLTIQKFPKILVIHLKRFSPVERFRGKLSVNVDFPVNNLDLSAYVANKGQSCTYHLYGVANHSGTSYSGHYTAYCKHPYSGEWHEYNDSKVYAVSSRSVITNEAYVLFYELAVQDYLS